MANNMEVPQILKIELPWDPAILLMGIYPKEWKSNVKEISAFHAHFSIIRNSQDTETTKMSINRGMNNKNVEYTYHGTSFGLKKKRRKSAILTTWMNVKNITLSEISQSQKDKRFQLDEVSKIVKYIEIG